MSDMDRIRELADDWDRYQQLPDTDGWRTSMLRTVLVEFEREINKLKAGLRLI